MARGRGRGKAADGPTLEALGGALIALVPAYFTAESLLATLPHPAHWFGTALGVALGYGLGALVAAYKEERFPFERARPPGPRPAAGSRRATPAAREPGRDAATRRDRGRGKP